MTLEEALERIKELEGEVAKFDEKAKALVDEKVTELNKEHEKTLQIQYNKGFDKAKNTFEKDVKDGYVSKDEVNEILAKRDSEANARETLLKMGVKNPKRALKLIDEDDFKTFGTDDFKEDDFKKKYGEDIVFTSNDGGNGEPNQNPANFMKNNKEPEVGLTAEKYEAMTPEEREKVSPSELLALL